MSSHILLNLLNELGKSDKMPGLPSILSLFHNKFNKFNNTRAQWECSGSVVECLTQDRGAAGSSLTGVTALCP